MNVYKVTYSYVTVPRWGYYQNEAFTPTVETAQSKVMAESEEEVKANLDNLLLNDYPKRKRGSAKLLSIDGVKSGTAYKMMYNMRPLDDEKLERWAVVGIPKGGGEIRIERPNSDRYFKSKGMALRRAKERNFYDYDKDVFWVVKRVRVVEEFCDE